MSRQYTFNSPRSGEELADILWKSAERWPTLRTFLAKLRRRTQREGIQPNCFEEPVSQVFVGLPPRKQIWLEFEDEGDTSKFPGLAKYPRTLAD